MEKETSLTAATWAVVAAAAILLTCAGSVTAIDYAVGLRFADGSTAKTIGLAGSTTLEVFVETTDLAAEMSEYLVAFSGSSPSGTDLAFSSSEDELTNWTYANSLAGDLVNRYCWAYADSQGDNVGGPFSLVVDSILIEASALGTYTIAPDLMNFDVLIVDWNDPAPTCTLAPGFASITLDVRYPGDANGDEAVDVSDLGILAGHYEQPGPWAWVDGDFSGDGEVDVSDLGILAGHYGEGKGAAVPEPTGAALFAVTALGLMRKHRSDSSISVFV